MPMDLVDIDGFSSWDPVSTTFSSSASANTEGTGGQTFLEDYFCLDKRFSGREYLYPMETGDGMEIGEEKDADDNEDNNAESEVRSEIDVDQDDPMSGWRDKQEDFLLEILRTNGLGDEIGSMKCNIFESHKLAPLHIVQIWNGFFWKKLSLQALSLVYQLGHGGHRCLVPKDSQNLTVIDVNRIHSIRVNWCGCSRSDQANHIEQLLRNHWYPVTVVNPHTCATFHCLDTFCMLNVVANVNVCNWVTSLETLSDGMRSGDVAYSFLLRMKRAGRGHDEMGIAGMKQGTAAVMCWACPQEG
ncbi:hypothetical protein C8J56DRAFT_881646 [Mycena floridula]|nr:hypothetical protein C8J56DRAFT_881646 [Mycena floridula]